MQQDIDMLNKAMAVLENANLHPQSFIDVDIIAITAKKINSGDLNVYDDSQVSWEEVTMYDLDKIKKLLLLIDTLLVEDTADAIINSIDCKYDPENPYYKPVVTSKYYNPSSTILPEQGDWRYEITIRGFVKELIKKRQKKEDFQKKLEQKRQERFITPAPLEMMESKTEDKLRKAEETIKELKKKIALLKEKNVSISSEETNVNVEDEVLKDGKPFVFLVDGKKYKLEAKDKNIRYLICLMAQKAFGKEKLVKEEYELLQYILKMSGYKGIETNYNKIIKKLETGFGNGGLLPKEKDAFEALRKKYGL